MRTAGNLCAASSRVSGTFVCNAVAPGCNVVTLQGNAVTPAGGGLIGLGSSAEGSGPASCLTRAFTKNPSRRLYPLKADIPG
jgi:hypothetical protein